MDRIPDRLDMTSAVYRGREGIKQTNKQIIEAILMSTHNIGFYGEVTKKYISVIIRYSLSVSLLHQ